jgi:hypothetical protein
MPLMSEPKKKAKKYPSRDKVKYVPIPLDLWDELEQLGKADDRSVSYMARKTIRLGIVEEKKRRAADE